MKLKNQKLAPPGGWKYQQPETGFWMNAITFETLLRKIAQHRMNMKLPAVHPNFQTLVGEIEDHICQCMEPQDQIRLCDGGVRMRAAVGWGEVMGFLKSNVKWIADGREQVPQDEAERRASICSTCPLNVPIEGCAVCKTGIKEYRETVVKPQPTSRDGQLRACGACGCDLKSIVHFPMDALRVKEGIEYPEWCWQRNGTVSREPIDLNV